MPEVKSPEIKELTYEEKVNAIANILKSACTGRVEPWQGNRGPMFNVYLKNNGDIPSGVKGFPTVKALAQGAIRMLRGSKYFIRFTFNLPDGSGGKLEQNATLVSAPEQGYLVFAGRESHNVTFGVKVEQAQTAKPKVENAVVDEKTGEVDLNLGELNAPSSSGIEIG